MKRTPEKPSPARPKTKKPPAAAPAPGGAQEDPAVLAFLRDLEHPRKAEILALRQIILGVDPAIREEIKWKAPSFRTTDHFATFNLRGKDGVRLILHTGAKVKASAQEGVPVADPTGLVEWLAKDRGLVTFADAKDVEAKRGALEALLRAWIATM